MLVTNAATRELWIDTRDALDALGFDSSRSSRTRRGFKCVRYRDRDVSKPDEFIGTMTHKVKSFDQAEGLKQLRRRCRELWFSMGCEAELANMRKYPYSVLDLLGGQYLCSPSYLNALAVRLLRKDFTLMGHYKQETGELTEQLYDLMLEELNK